MPVTAPHQSGNKFPVCGDIPRLGQPFTSLERTRDRHNFKRTVAVKFRAIIPHYNKGVPEFPNVSHHSSAPRKQLWHTGSIASPVFARSGCKRPCIHAPSFLRTAGRQGGLAPRDSVERREFPQRSSGVGKAAAQKTGSIEIFANILSALLLLLPHGQQFIHRYLKYLTEPI